MSTPLTVHLVSLATPRPYSAATQHEFLAAAGTGTLSPDLLSLNLNLSFRAQFSTAAPRKKQPETGFEPATSAYHH